MPADLRRLLPFRPVDFRLLLALVPIAGILAGVALLASYLPARRAAAADPVASLRRS